MSGMSKENYEFILSHLPTLDLDLESGAILNRNANALKKGYPKIKLGGRQGKSVLQHQVFAVARWGEECIGMTVNHINEIRTDNRACNLELVTLSENVKKMTFKPDLEKLREKQMKPVVQYDMNGNFIKEYGSTLEASKSLSGSNGHLHNHLKGKTKVFKGFIFRYKD